MLSFRIALTGDFLNEQGASAYGDLSLSLWDEKPFLQYHFLMTWRHGPAMPLIGRGFTH